MKRVSVGLLVAALCAASLQADPRRIDPKAYLEHVRFLASEDLEGRGNGSRGLERRPNTSPHNSATPASSRPAMTERSFSDSR